MKTLATLLALLAIGCAPRAIVVDPITPEVKKARVVAKTVTKSAERTEKSASEVSIKAKLLISDVDAASRELDRLRALPDMPPVLDDLKTMLGALKSSTADLAADAARVLDDAGGTVTDSRDSETTLGELEKSTTAHDKQVDKLEDAYGKAAVKASKWDDLMAWKRTIIIVGSIGIIIFCLLRYGTAIGGAVRVVKNLLKTPT